MYQLKTPTQLEIDDCASQIFEEILKINEVEMLQKLNQDENKLLKGFLDSLNQVFQQCKEMQFKKQKGQVAFIHIFYLKSSLMTGTYEFMMSVYDNNSYYDRLECSSYWVPELFVKCYEEDLKQFQKIASRQIIGFGKEQFLDAKFHYYDIYLEMILKFVKNHVRQITELASYQEMMKVEMPAIFYGGYMDRGVQIYPQEGVGN